MRGAWKEPSKSCNVCDEKQLTVNRSDAPEEKINKCEDDIHKETQIK